MGKPRNRKKELPIMEMKLLQDQKNNNLEDGDDHLHGRPSNILSLLNKGFGVGGFFQKWHQWIAFMERKKMVTSIFPLAIVLSELEKKKQGEQG